MSDTKPSRETLTDLTAPAEERTDEDYRSWKAAKVRKVLKAAEDGEPMIPADKVWERFGFER